MREFSRSQLRRFLRKTGNAKTRFGVVVGLLILSSFLFVSRFEETRANHTGVTPVGAFHACNVVGQTEANSTDAATSGAPDACNGASSTVDLTLFNKDTVDNGPIDRGLSAPAYAVFGGGYLWVTDSANHRVLGFAVNGSNVLSDRIADVVLTGNGQTDATAFIKVNTAVTSQTGFNTPAGLAYDSANNRLYVVDQGNNRVMVFAATFSNGMSASYVLGQANFTANSTGTTQATFNMSSSTQRAGAAYYNNLLFVADPSNSRVLVFNTKSLSNGMNAAAVYGQSTFTGASAATAQAGMNQPAGVAVDTGDSRVLVADNTNNRVLLHDLAALYSMVNVGASGGIQRTTNGGTTWTAQTSGVAVSLNGVYFVDSNTGWAVGNSGTILKTTDGGSNWVAQTSGVAGNLINVFFIDSNTGWASGNSGTLLKTTNGGSAWSAQTSGLDSVLSGLYFVDSNTGWISGGTGNIIKTTNGGTTWTAQTSGTSQDMGKLFFLDANTGWAVADAGTILKTTNGGTTWTAQTSGVVVKLSIPFFVDANTGWIAGNSGTILKTANGGTTWTAQTSGTAENLHGLGFIDANVGWITADNSVILKTVNGGTTWTAQTSAITQALTSAAIGIGINGPNALNVLGQANFTSSGAATTQAGMSGPQGVAYDTTGKLVFVGDTTSNRILVMDGNTATIANGENAANVLGQADFTSAGAATTQAGVSSPNGLAYDSTNKYLYGAESGNHRVIAYDVTAISNGESAAECLGQLGASDACVYTKGTAQNRPNARGLNAPRGAVVGNSKLFVSDTSNNRVLVYNLDSNGQLADRVADNVLGQASLHSGTSAGTTSTTLSSPRELAYDSTNNRLFVYDYSNNRVIIYDVATITDGEAAVNVLCQANFSSSSTGTTATTCNFAISGGGMETSGGLAFDSANNRLFVSDGGNARVLVFDVRSAGSASSTLCSVATTGVADGMTASCAIGQTNLTSNSCAFTQAGLCNPTGLAYDSGNTRLFAADLSRSGVMMYNLASGPSNGMDASAVLGQTSYTAFTFPMTVTAGTFAWPQGLAYDGSKYLFITTMNTEQRVMVQDVTPATLSNGQNASGVIGQAGFDGASANASLTGVGTTPSGMYYDTNTNRLYLADRGNNRLMAYDLARVTTSSLSDCVRNDSCSRTVAAEDSQFTLAYSVASGSLPTGLSLNSSTGAITGTPTTAGASSFSIAATDTASGGFYTVGSQKALTLTITDTTAPVVSSVASGSVSTSGATITWTTDEASSSQVEYGLTNAYGTSTTEADTSTRVTSHSVALTGLTAGTTYHYRVKSNDASSNQGVSADQTFVTASSGGSSVDSTPPGPATNISGVYGSNTITLQWTNPAANDLSKIEVWRNSGGNSVVAFLTAVASSVSRFTDTGGLEASKTYIYQLVTVDTIGNKSVSQEAAVSTAGAAVVIPAVAVCGNTSCESGETASGCPADCASAVPLAPKLELTLRVNVVEQDGTVITANRSESGDPLSEAGERKISLTFALALSLLMMGAFLIHTHTTGLDKNPMSFFAIVPLLFASSSTSYQYLRKSGPESCKGSHFARHIALKHFSRATLAATMLAGALKLFIVLAISSVIPDQQYSYAQAMNLRPGDRMTASLTVRNTGTGRATNVLASLGCPAGLTLTPASVKINGNSSTLNPCSGVPFVELAAGLEHTVEASFVVEPSAVGIGALSLRASATSAETGTTTVNSNAISFAVVAAPEPKAQPQPEPQPRRQPQPEPMPQPKPKPQAEPQPEIQPEPQSISVPTSQSRGFNETLPSVVPELLETALNLSAVRLNVSWNNGVFGGAVSSGELAGLVPLSFTAQGPMPVEAIRVEMVVQSDPQIFSCPSADGIFNCQVNATLPPGRHTLFAQAMEQDGSRRRISNVVEFDVKLPACFDALDNDNDTLMDYPDDPGCTDRTDNDELEPIAVALAPIVSEPIKDTIAKTVAKLETSKVYRALDKQVLNNPVVEKANTQVAAPIIVAAAAANTASAVATAGVSLASILTYLQGFLTQPLLLFTRRRRKQWGMVYSSLAKVPVDLALVRLFSIPAGGAVDSSAGRLLQTRVTDKEGRYLFIASPGTYRIEVTKPGYTFPSAYLKGKTTDFDFADLYHGGPLTITASSTITRPIPLDPVEKTQTSGEILSRKRKRFIQTGLAYSGPLFAIASVAITPTLTTTALLGFQFLMLGLFKRLAQGSKPRSFASVRDAQTRKPIAFAVARIFDSTFNKLLETQITDKDGRYGFLVGRGSFYITVEKPGYGAYRSEVMDLTRAESAEIVKRDIKLKPGGSGTPPLTPPPQGGENGKQFPPLVEGRSGGVRVQTPPLSGAPPSGAVGVPLVKNSSQADLPAQAGLPKNGNGKNGSGKNGNGKKNGNGYGHA